MRWDLSSLVVRQSSAFGAGRAVADDGYLSLELCSPIIGEVLVVERNPALIARIVKLARHVDEDRRVAAD